MLYLLEMTVGILTVFACLFISIIIALIVFWLGMLYCRGMAESE
jgi:hypothetical protein